MLRKLKALGDDLFLWDLYVRFPDHQVHKHIRATHPDAQAVYAELLAAAARAKVGLKHADPQRIVAGPETLGGAASAFEREILAEGQSPEHVQAVARTLQDLRALKGDDLPVAKIGRADVVEWRAWRLRTPKVTKYHKGKLPSARTVNKEYAHLHRFLSWCVEQGFRDDNPAASVKRVKAAEPPTKVAGWAAFGKVTDYLWKKHPEAALFMEILGETGARFKEVAEAKVGDVDRQRRIWTGVQKGKRTVELPAFEWVLEAYRRARKEKLPASAPLCPDPKGRAWPYSWLRSILKRACEAVKVEPFTPHAVRHGRSTWDVEAGLDPRTVQELRGHKQLSTTERYFRTARMAEKVHAAAGIKRRPVPSAAAKKAPRRRARAV